MEEPLLKDNEKIPFLNDDPLLRSETQGFSSDQMVRCEECLRANPPTRVNCLYCAAALPAMERPLVARTLNLKPIDNAAHGYNNILLPNTANRLDSEAIETSATLLKLTSTDLQRIMSAGLPLPLARTATREEAEHVRGRLAGFGFDSIVVSDDELGLNEPASCVRAAETTDMGLTLKQSGGGDGIQVSWNQIMLLVSGRLMTKKVESTERKGRRGEAEIVEANEFFADELLMDLYVQDLPGSIRMAANNFDFSCLSRKSLVAAENFFLLVALIRQQSPGLEHDDSYMSVRQALDPIWTSERHTGSRGWRRDRPGKYNIEAVTQTSNENQFTRYSRLRHFLMQRERL